MKRFICSTTLVGIVTFMGILPGPRAQGLEQPLNLVYEIKSGDGRVGSTSELIYRFLPGVTRIETYDEILHIDYRRRIIYRFNAGGLQCHGYLLEPQKDVEKTQDPAPESDLLFKKELSDQLGTASLEKGMATTKKVNGYPVRKVAIVWGKNLLLQRRLSSHSLILYGREFLPEMQEYWVTTDIDRVDDLFYLAAAYEPVFTANPLLARVDLLGTIKLLQGVPVRFTTSRYSAILHDLSPEKDRTVKFELPESCQTP